MNTKPVIVVEGKSDVQRLENLIDADFVICNGSAIDEITINYIKELTKTRKVIIFTDPDYPGEKIRRTISEQVGNIYHAFVDRNKASNGKKLGIAECEKDEILRALNEYVKFNKTNEDTISVSQFVELGFNGNKIRRDKLCKMLSISPGTSKTVLKRINMLGISFKDLEELSKKV